MSKRPREGDGPHRPARSGWKWVETEWGYEEWPLGRLERWIEIAKNFEENPILQGMIVGAMAGLSVAWMYTRNFGIGAWNIGKRAAPAAWDFGKRAVPAVWNFGKWGVPATWNTVKHASLKAWITGSAVVGSIYKWWDSVVQYWNTLPELTKWLITQKWNQGGGKKALENAAKYGESAILAAHDIGPQDILNHPAPASMAIAVGNRLLQNSIEHQIKSLKTAIAELNTNPQNFDSKFRFMSLYTQNIARYVLIYTGGIEQAAAGLSNAIEFGYKLRAQDDVNSYISSLSEISRAISGMSQLQLIREPIEKAIEQLTAVKNKYSK